MLSRWRNIAVRHPRSIALAAVFLIAQILELLLLQRKYDIFTGGFLQPYSFVSLSERLVFLAAGAWMDLFFFGALALLWYRICERLRVRYIVAAYHYFSITAIFLVIWLAIQFKVLAYFSDTLNFLIVRNLAGGSLSAAIAYVADEARIFIVMFLLAVGLYLAGMHYINRAGRQAVDTLDHVRGLPAWRTILAGLAVTIILLVYLNHSHSLRYGVGKKTSYLIVSAFFDVVTDFDRDGYGIARNPADPEPMNDRVYPGAVDIPDNGIDEDRIGGDFSYNRHQYQDPLLLLSPKQGKHILLVVLESARWDLLGKYIDGKAVAPNIMAIAWNGSVIPFAYTHTGYTTSTLRAIFNRTHSRNVDRMSFVDYLQQAGYAMSFISGQDESFGGIAASTGMNRPGNHLFDARTAIEDRVYPSTDSGSLRLSEERVVEEFSRHTRALDWNQPQFFYVNLQAAHFPYTHPGMPSLIGGSPVPRSKISAENREWLEETYWNAIANADLAIGKMISQLQALGQYENTLVVVASDHGESLFDDGFLGHGHALNELQTRIPLVINLPGIKISQAVGLVDLAQLVIELATGQHNTEHWQNRDAGVLQFIGGLSRPQLIGTVSHGDRRTILDMRTQQVYFSDLKLRMDIDAALREQHLASRVEDLVFQWEQLRWQDYLARQANTGR